MTEVTPHLRRYIEIVAAGRTRANPDQFDECVQEGMIAAWRAMQKNPGKPDVYYRVAAKNGIAGPLRGRASFGHESSQGKQDASSASQSIWGTNSAGDDVLLVEPAVEAPYGAVELEGAVRKAVAALPEEDRLLVYGRYWEDRPFQELSAQLGRPTGTLSRRWTQIVRPALAEALRPLVAA